MRQEAASKGGKELLFKIVAQLILDSAMSMFLSPKQLCLEIERMMKKFRWKSSPNKEGGIR